MDIEFFPSSQDVFNVVPPPKPAVHYLPNWYKQAQTGRSNPIFSDDGSMTLSYKACMPLLDSLKAGYIQESWCDFYFDSSQSGNNDYRYSYPTSPELMKVRNVFHDKSEMQFPVSLGAYCPVELVWFMPWIPKLPKGYSILVTSPLNRLDLPFSVTTGIIDSDLFYHSQNGQVPFYMHANFKGIIPAGTPMFQMIPIKRSKWKSKIMNFDPVSSRKRGFEIIRKFSGAYRDNFWVPKSYE